MFGTLYYQAFVKASDKAAKPSDAKPSEAKAAVDLGAAKDAEEGKPLLADDADTGFTPAVLQPGEPRLQLLRDRPAFLQIGGFDALMQQLTAPRIPMIR